MGSPGDPGEADPGPPENLVNRFELGTPRLLLSAGRPDDEEAVFGLTDTHGEVGQAVTGTLCWDGAKDTEETREWLRKTREHPWRGGGLAWGMHWVIRDRSGALAGTAGAPLGVIGLMPTETAGRAEVGYWLGPDWWGRGLMKEALTAVLRCGFADLGLAKIEAVVFTQNDRGIALLESMGLPREGVQRRYVRKAGQWMDVVRFGVLPGEIVPG